MSSTTQTTDQMLTNLFRYTLHEFAAPLNGIVSAARLLNENVEENNPEFQNDLIGMIMASSCNLLSIYERVVEVVNQERLQKFKLKESYFDFSSWLNNFLTSMFPIALEKNITIDWQVQGMHPTNILADKTYLTQIAYNLLNNAIKHSPEWSKVKVVCQFDEMLTIHISDEGEGIPAAELPFIWMEYHGGKYKGLGLGLTIAKNLTEMMGGHISVNSIIGKGTSFTVVLPFRTM